MPDKKDLAIYLHNCAEFLLHKNDKYDRFYNDLSPDLNLSKVISDTLDILEDSKHSKKAPNKAELKGKLENFKDKEKGWKALCAAARENADAVGFDLINYCDTKYGDITNPRCICRRG